MLHYALTDMAASLSAFDIPDLLIPIAYCSAEPAALIVQETCQAACNYQRRYAAHRIYWCIVMQES